MAVFSTFFMSEALKRPIPIYVVLPSDHNVMADEPMPKKNVPFKTVYMLEGVTGNCEGPIKYSRMPGLAEDYNVAVVTIGGDNKWYANSERSGDHYSDMIIDIVNFTRRCFNLSRKREDTFVAGFSMGGYGALLTGFRYPHIFSRIIANACALNKQAILNSDNHPTWDMYTKENYEIMFDCSNGIEEYENSWNDYEYLAQKVATEKPELMPKVFMCTTNGDQTFPANVAFANGFLKPLGYDVTWVDAGEGHHSYWSFDKEMDYAFKWLPLDPFVDNYKYYGPEAWCSVDNWCHWKSFYNVELEDGQSVED